MTESVFPAKTKIHFTEAALNLTVPMAPGETSVRQTGPVGAEEFVSIFDNALGCALEKMGAESTALVQRALNLSEAEVCSSPAARFRPLQIGEASFTNDAARWTAGLGRQMGMHAPILEAVAGIRVLSEREKQNSFFTTPFRHPFGHFGTDRESVWRDIRAALDAASLVACAETMAVLTCGARQYRFAINPLEILIAWEAVHPAGGALFDFAVAALESTPGLPNLLYDEDVSEQVMGRQEKLRQLVWQAHLWKVGAPVLLAALDYLDGCRGAWMPVNLIEARPTRMAR